MYSTSVLVMFVDTVTVLQSSYSVYIYAASEVSMGSLGGPIVTSGSEMTASGVPLSTSGVQLTSSGAVCFRCPGVHSDVTTHVQAFTSGTTMTVSNVHFRFLYSSSTSQAQLLTVAAYTEQACLKLQQRRRSIVFY